MKGFLLDADLAYKYADEFFLKQDNLSTSLEKAESYTYKYKWRQVLNKNKTEHKNFSKVRL